MVCPSLADCAGRPRPTGDEVAILAAMIEFTADDKAESYSVLAIFDLVCGRWNHLVWKLALPDAISGGSSPLTRSTRY